MRVRIATLADLKAIDSLRRSEQEAVGFIPLSRYTRDLEASRPTLVLVEENDDPVGFAFWTQGWPVARIQQVVIRSDARRRERATALVDRIVSMATRARHTGLSCRCREDLEATAFWPALGFRVVRQEEAGRRRIPLLRYYWQINLALFDLGEYIAPTRALIGQRRGYRLIRPEGA